MLAVDVGNTNVVLGLYRGDQLLYFWRISTRRDATVDETAVVLRELFDHHGIPLAGVDAVVISSVVPPLTPVWQQLSRQYLGVEPLVVTADTDTGLRLDVDNPRELGADRIVNAVAAWRKYGAPVIVVDFGTATTVDAIGDGGVYLGGAIAPGIGISAEALFRVAAQLYRVEILRPPRAIGRNTVHGMQSGIVFGFAGQVDALVERVRDEMGARARVVATGGLADLVASESHTIEVVDPLLTLEGLRWIHRRHRQAEAEERRSGSN
jgi:type III pantothenate kinase